MGAHHVAMLSEKPLMDAFSSDEMSQVNYRKPAAHCAFIDKQHTDAYHAKMILKNESANSL